VSGGHEGQDLCAAVLHSVPARLAGRRVQVALGADWIAVRHAGVLVARHPVAAQGQRGPGGGSLPGGADPTARRVARRHRAGHRAGDDTFTASHQRFWDTARRAGDSAGTKALIGVLLHRIEAVLAGIDAAAAGERPVPTLDGYDQLLEPGA